MTQNNLGNALRDQGIRTGGQQGRTLLFEAVSAFNNALEIRTYKTLALQWAQTHYNLGQAYDSLEEWKNAATCYTQVLKVYSDSVDIINRIGFIYHERLFQFDNAYEMDAVLVNELNIDALSVFSNFMEKHFTTGRFDEMEKRITAVLLKLENGDEYYAPLVAFDIAGRLARNQRNQVLAKIDKLSLSIRTQPEEYAMGWVFDGTKHFISTTSKIPDSNRQWLISFFSALEEKKRDVILSKLNRLKKNLP
jgi:tetratricopeptide (TPR) repeat protein